MKCVFCSRTTKCGCHDQEPLFEESNVKEEGQYKINISNKAFEDFLDGLDPE